jgi:predicted transcriptional regulator
MVRNKARDVRTIEFRDDLDHEKLSVVKARRTAFVARFIVLRESKRTRAHRRIEQLEWTQETTAEQLADIIRSIFKENGDNMDVVERDVSRALAHSSRSLSFFVAEYVARATNNFIDALFDYEASNQLLFGADEQPKPGGWRLPSELRREKRRADQVEGPHQRA